MSESCLTLTLADLQAFGVFDDQSRREADEWVNMEAEIIELQLQTNIIGTNMDYFIKYVDTDILSKLDFELVIYDEIEKFRQFDDPEFSYPYQSRKSKLNSFTLDPVDFEFKDG